MLSKAKLKYIHSLGTKKVRDSLRLFVAEGPKVVGDVMAIQDPTLVVATEEWLRNNRCPQSAEVIVVSDDELSRVSFLKHPQQVLAVFPMFDNAGKRPPLSIALDGIQDPGNLGTIIRIADWFGIESIYCSRNTADVYNPKVIQATMGSIARVNVEYVDLPDFLQALPEGTPVYGTLLDGESIYEHDLRPEGVLVMGNEGNGISAAVQQILTHRLLIPPFPLGRPTADSLNVATATAILCSELRRNCR